MGGNYKPSKYVWFISALLTSNSLELRISNGILHSQSVNMGQLQKTTAVFFLDGESSYLKGEI